MSTKFYLVNRQTGERFKGNKQHYPVLYDSGYAAFVRFDGWYTHVSPADPKVWKVVFKEKENF
jgi:hypothetical protein